ALVSTIKQLGCFYVDAKESIKLAIYGAGIDITKPIGKMLLHMGAGKISCGLVTSNEVTIQRQIKYGTTFVNEEIINYLKNKKKIDICETTVEKVKNTIGTLLKTKKGLDLKIYGYDISSGMPTDADINEDDIRDVMQKFVYQITALVTTVLEE